MRAYAHFACSRARLAKCARGLSNGWLAGRGQPRPVSPGRKSLFSVDEELEIQRKMDLPRAFLRGVREGQLEVVRRSLASGLSPNTLYIQRRVVPCAPLGGDPRDPSVRNHLRAACGGSGEDAHMLHSKPALHVTPALVLAVEQWDCNGPEATFQVVKMLLEAGANTRAMSSVSGG